VGTVTTGGLLAFRLLQLLQALLERFGFTQAQETFVLPLGEILSDPCLLGLPANQMLMV
jgi:hypothetical protein